MAHEKEKLICGIIMPISEIDGCSEEHWGEVHEILIEAIETTGFDGNLVSSADEVGIIHKRIIQNLYDNPIVICDVSGKNPNVMFELGLRLAFDKPTIIIKDDKTSYSFDTSAIEHIEYPRDLRFSKIIEFKLKLTEKLRATYEKSNKDANYTTFLKHFGEFTVAKLEKKEVSGQEYILDELKSISLAMRKMERNQMMARDFGFESNSRFMRSKSDLNICMLGKTDKEIADGLNALVAHPSVIKAEIVERGKKHMHIQVELTPDANIAELEKLAGGRDRRSLRKAKSKS
ncbi:MAG: hypothetical protein WC635_12400 [Bacteriovorax sp.]|jgi:hypothetical protein